MGEWMRRIPGIIEEQIGEGQSRREQTVDILPLSDEEGGP
jgi:hypothetical protein